MRKFFLMLSILLMTNFSYAMPPFPFKHKKQNIPQTTPVTKTQEMEDFSGYYEGYCGDGLIGIKVLQDQDYITFIYKVEGFEDTVVHYRLAGVISDNKPILSNTDIANISNQNIAVWDGGRSRLLLADFELMSFTYWTRMQYVSSQVKKTDFGLSISSRYMYDASEADYGSEESNCFFNKKDN